MEAKEDGMQEGGKLCDWPFRVGQGGEVSEFGFGYLMGESTDLVVSRAQPLCTEPAV